MTFGGRSVIDHFFERGQGKKDHPNKAGGDIQLLVNVADRPHEWRLPQAASTVKQTLLKIMFDKQ
jgi:hypothetical protein